MLKPVNPKPKPKKKPSMLSKKGPVNNMKKPSKRRVMYRHGGMTKAKPC